MIDTPGVFSAEKNEHVAAVVGSIDYGKIKDPDAAVMKIMQERPGVIEKHFSVRVNNDKGKTLEEIAVKKKLLLKGEEPDIERAARMILKMVQKGEIRY